MIYLIVHHYSGSPSRIIGCYLDQALRAKIAKQIIENPNWTEKESIELVDLEVEG